MRSDAKKRDKLYEKARDVFDKERLLQDLKKLGIAGGDILHLKVSLSSIGYVEGGADTLIEALLEAVGESGTIVADAFVSVYPMPLSEEDSRKISDKMTPSYAGALANSMVRHPKMFRSSHPIQKFVAIGAEAEKLMKEHTPDSYAYDVLRVLAEKDAKNLKIGNDEKVIGVGTTHVAIGSLKFKQRRPRCGLYYLDHMGEIVFFERNWAGGCAEGFGNFLPLYRDGGAILSKGKVGNAQATITSMKKTLEIEVEKLSEDPTFFFCSDPTCVSCRLSWEFSNGNLAITTFYNVLYRFKRLSNKIFFAICKRVKG